MPVQQLGPRDDQSGTVIEADTTSRGEAIVNNMMTLYVGVTWGSVKDALVDQSTVSVNQSSTAGATYHII